jgi:FkbM family methyltransferase
MKNVVQSDLVFDFGLHKGFDAEFYLNKGFRVIGLEAVPELAEISRTRLSKFGNKITIVNKALYDLSDSFVSFFMVPSKDDWGSLNKGIAEKGVEQSVEINVPTINLSTLFNLYGVPYYIKCDMEGGDLIFLNQLLTDSRRPKYISVEMNNGLEGDMLLECGYSSAQMVNQWLNPFTKPPSPALEKDFVDVNFTSEMSGLFGLELPVNRWMPIENVKSIYDKWKELRDISPQLAIGWLDLHAVLNDK